MHQFLIVIIYLILSIHWIYQFKEKTNDAERAITLEKLKRFFGQCLEAANTIEDVIYLYEISLTLNYRNKYNWFAIGIL